MEMNEVINKTLEWLEIEVIDARTQESNGLSQITMTEYNKLLKYVKENKVN